MKYFVSVEHNEKTKQHLLYYACVIMGQSVVRVMKGQNKMRRDALGYFVKACRLVQGVSLIFLEARLHLPFWVRFSSDRCEQVDKL